MPIKQTLILEPKLRTMNKKLCVVRSNTLFIVAMIFSLLISSCSKETTLYVSPNGNDTWSGKLVQPNEDKTDGPLATLTGARDAIRKLKESTKLPKGNIIVEVQKGEYEMPVTLELDSMDG